MTAAIEFGLDPSVVLEVVNSSSGRSGSTETKWPTDADHTEIARWVQEQVHKTA